jgi:hypothetical protein
MRGVGRRIRSRVYRRIHRRIRGLVIRCGIGWSVYRHIWRRWIVGSGRHGGIGCHGRGRHRRVGIEGSVFAGYVVLWDGIDDVAEEIEEEDGKEDDGHSGRCRWID